jgi:hypothetical protein
MCLDPTLQVTHLNRWTLSKVIRTDIFRRAVPWGRIILATGKLPNDLNLSMRQRFAAALAPLALLGLASAPVAALLGANALAVGLLTPVVASLALHLPLLRFFHRAAGLRFALGGWLFHQVHLTYSAATMAALCVERVLRPASAG